MAVRHNEQHRSGNTGWLRAAVLGANDGLLSTASLVLGIAAAHGTKRNILIAGVAGIFAGAMSMAAGEYVSVSSQADAERADLAKEAAELQQDRGGELQELADIYVGRGLPGPLAMQVAEELMRHDALGAHMRDELGISELTSANPLQAAMSSALSFVAGGVLPLLAAASMQENRVVAAIWLISAAALVLFGFVAAKLSGAGERQVVVRMTLWGLAAMLVTTTAGALFGART